MGESNLPYICPNGKVVGERVEWQTKDLIALIAHDLKTPLTSVLGYLCLLKDTPSMCAEDLEKYLQIAIEKAQHLDKIIDDYLEVFLYENRQVDLKKDYLNLNNMLSHISQEFSKSLNTHGNIIKLSMEVPMVVYADSTRLSKVFHILLENAITNSYQNTQIQICGKIEKNNIIISFVNSGKNIPQEFLSKIFDPLVRLDEARSSSSGGAGLGLTIAKHIVLLHGGSLMATCQKESIEFIVSIPLSGE